MHPREKNIQNTYTAIFCCTDFPLYPADKMLLAKLQESRITPQNMKSATWK